jgi:hypothetical protein
MVTATAVCLDFDATAVDGVMTLAGTASLDVYGSLLWPATNFIRSNTGSTTFRATSTGKTISLNGKLLAGSATFDGVGGGWTLTSAFYTPSNFTLTNGSLNLGGFTASGFNFSSNNSNARTLAFNGGNITILGSASVGNQTLWNAATATNLTVTGTPTVNVINNSTNSGFTRTFTHGGTAGGSEPNAVNLNIQAGDTGSLISVQGVYKNLDFTGCSSTLSNSTRFIYGNLIINSGMTLTAGTNSTNFAGTSGTQQITSAALNFDFPVNFGYNLTTTAATGNGTTATLTFGTSTQCIAVGSTIIVAGVTPAGYNGTYTVTASTNTTVSYLNATTGAQTVAGTIVNGGSTSYVLQDDLSVGTATSRTITLNTGTLNLNNFTLTSFGAFSSNNSNTRAIAFGTGNITCTYNLGASNTVWNCPTITNLTVTGTPTVNVTGTSSGAFTRTVSHGNTSGGTEPNAITVNVSAGSDTISINGCFIDLNLTGFTGTLAGNTRFIYGNLIISSGTTVTPSTLSTSFCRASGTQQITTNAKNLSFPINFGYGLTTTAATGDGTTATLTVGSTLNCIAVGSTITVVNVVPSGYNGTYTVTASTNTTVSYLNSTTGAQTVAGSVANAGSTTYTLLDALNVGTATNRPITLNTGTLNLNNFTFTLYGNFSSSNSNTRSIAFGTGNITITHAATGQTIWSMATATNFTVTGTPTVNVTGDVPSGTTRFINHGQTAGGSETNSVSFYISAGAEPFTIQGFIRNLDFTGYTAALNNSVRTIYGNLTLSSGMSLVAGVSTTTFGSTNATPRTITTNAQTLDFPVTFNGVGGSWQLQDNLACGTSTSRTMTLTAGTLDLNTSNITLFGGFVGTGSTARTIAFGTGQFFLTGTTATSTLLWSVTGTNLTITGTNPTISATGNSAGERDISHVPTTVAENLAININVTAGSADLGFGGGAQLVKSVDFTGFTGRIGNAGLSGGCIFNIYNNMTLNTGMTLIAGNTSWIFRGSSGTQVLTSNGVTITSPLNFGTGTNTTTTYQLADALTVASDKTINAISGIFDSNAKSITCGIFGWNNTNTKTLTLANSSITIIGGTSTTGFLGSTTGTTYNFTGAEVVFTTTGTAALGGIGSGATNSGLTITMSGTNGILIIGTSSQGATIGTLRNTVQPCTVSLLNTASALTVTNFNLSGTAGNLVTLNSSVAGTARTISKASGTTDAYYLNIQDSTATGGTWNAYESTNSGNNTGWNFIHLRSIDETSTAADTVTVLVALNASLNETVSASDSVLGVPSFSTQVDESASAADSVLVVASTFSAINLETALATETVSALGVLNAVLAEAVLAADAALVAASTFSAINLETALATETVSALGVLNAVLAETATGSETNVAQLDLPVSVTEAATGSETNVATIGFAATILESALGADTALVAPSTFGAAVLEIANALDTLVATAVFLASVSESSQGADTILARFLWEVIDDSQNVTWQNIDNSQTQTWALLNTAQSTTWQNIDNAQNTSWTNIDDAQAPGWNGIPTAE